MLTFRGWAVRIFKFQSECARPISISTARRKCLLKEHIDPDQIRRQMPWIVCSSILWHRQSDSRCGAERKVFSHASCQQGATTSPSPESPVWPSVADLVTGVRGFHPVHPGTDFRSVSCECGLLIRDLRYCHLPNYTCREHASLAVVL